MNGEITRAYGERLADQMACLDRIVQETSGHQRGIGCYVAREVCVAYLLLARLSRLEERHGSSPS